jgi:hypothetical protein
MTRGQWTLIGLLVVQLALIAVLKQPSGAATTEAHPLIADLDPGAVTRIEVGSKAGETLILKRGANGWSIVTGGGYPADATKVDELLDKLKEASVRSAVVTNDTYHDSLEVSEEKAQARVRLFQEGSDEPIADLIVGKATTGGSHVRVAGDEDVYEIRDLSSWQLRPEPGTWMQRTLVDVPVSSVQRLAVSNVNGSFALEKAGGEWIVTTPASSEGQTCTTDKVEGIVRTVATLTATDAVGVVDPEAHGLGAEATVVTLEHDEGSVTVRIGGPVPDKSGQLYVTRDGFVFAATQWESSLGAVTAARLEDLLP